MVLGLKTEGDCTVLENRNGGRSEILGGLLYMCATPTRRSPAFVNTERQAAASFVEESLRPASRYSVYLRAQVRDVRAADFRRAATAGSCPGWQGNSRRRRRYSLAPLPTVSGRICRYGSGAGLSSRAGAATHTPCWRRASALQLSESGYRQVETLPDVSMQKCPMPGAILNSFVFTVQ